MSEKIDNYPSRIWAGFAFHGGGTWFSKAVGSSIEYRRADLADAEIARLKNYIREGWERSDMCASHDLPGVAADNCNCGLVETLKALTGKEAG